MRVCANEQHFAQENPKDFRSGPSKDAVSVKLVSAYAPLAQLVEQLTLNQWVPGSNP